MDGGVTFLAIAGAAYAGKKLYSRAKKDKLEE
ncbi:MAG: PID-CTERM protein-sorting domain-containing protein [Bacteroidota bacterium]